MDGKQQMAIYVESVYQRDLRHKIEKLIPGCIVLKNDPQWIQGIPDLVILYEDKWAMLEVKTSANSPRRPNQHHYISTFNEMSFASFIYPANEKEVLNDLQQAFGLTGSSRIS